MGLLWLLAVDAMLLLGGYWAARCWLGQPPGAARGIGACILAWAWATIGMEALGSFGLLSRGPLAAWSAAGLAIGAGLRWKEGRGDDPIGAEAPVEAAAVVAAALVTWAGLKLGAAGPFLPVKVVSDGPIYHLYFAVRWWKAAGLAPVAAPFGENAATYFPAAGDLWFAWLTVGWGGDAWARAGQAPFLLLAAACVAGMARRLGADRSSAWIASAWFAMCSPLLLFSFEPNVDTIFVAAYLAACFFVLRYALGDDGRASLVLGGLAAGGAWATKPTGTAFVPPLLVAVLALVAWRRRKSPGAGLAEGLVVAASSLVLPGYWFGRNAWLTGNPLYPLHLEVGGRTLLRGWYGPDVMALSVYYLPLRDWRSLVDTMLAALDPRLTPAWLAALAIGPLAIRPRPERRAAWAIGALALANVAIYWLAIPYRTQQRFMLQAIGLAAVPLAAGLSLGRGPRVAATLLLALHLLTPQAWPWARSGEQPPWDLSRQIPNALAPFVPLPPSAATAAIGLGALAVAWAWSRVGGRRRLAVAAAMSLAVWAGSAYVSIPAGVDPRVLFYPGFRDYYLTWLDLELRIPQAGTRIAYAGTNIPYYLYGSGLRNDVLYVNVDDHPDWLLHDYHRRAVAEGHPTWPHPRPGWDRLRPDYDAWLANLRRERIKVLVVARVNPAEGPHNVADAEGFPVERGWAEGHPEAFEPLAGRGDPQLRAYLVK